MNKVKRIMTPIMALVLVLKSKGFVFYYLSGGFFLCFFASSSLWLLRHFIIDILMGITKY